MDPHRRRRKLDLIKTFKELKELSIHSDPFLSLSKCKKWSGRGLKSTKPQAQAQPSAHRAGNGRKKNYQGLWWQSEISNNLKHKSTTTSRHFFRLLVAAFQLLLPVSFLFYFIISANICTPSTNLSRSLAQNIFGLTLTNLS